MKTKLYLIPGFIATLLALASCQREPAAPENPSYDPSTNSVLTKLTLNVSTSNGPENYETKMTGAAVQITGQPFRGMDETHLLAYKLTYPTTAAKTFMYDPSHESSVALKDFNLGTMFVANEISSSSSSRTVEVSLPLGTNAIMLYAKAPKTPGADDAEGRVDLTHNSATAFEQNPTGIKFKLADRLVSETAFDQFADLVSGMLTGFFRTGLQEETQANGFATYADHRYAFWWADDNSGKGDFDVKDNDAYYNNGDNTTHPGYTFYTGTKLWREYGLQYAQNEKNRGNLQYATYTGTGATVEMKALEESLGQLYAGFCIIKTSATNANLKELRSGSTSAILRTIKDLAAVVDKVAKAHPNNPEEQIAQLLAEELQNRILRYFYAPLVENPNTHQNEYDWSSLSFLPMASMTSSIDNYFPNKTVAANFNEVTDAFFVSATGFPLNLGLPAGAAILAVNLDATPKEGSSEKIAAFSYLKEIPAYGMGSLDAKMPITNYRYPPELMYFANTNIRTNDSELDVAYPSTVTAWDTGSWTDWTIGSVTPNTRNVALIKQVNYGNALLQTNVKYDENITAVEGYDVVGLHDNNSVLHPGEKDNVIPFSDGNALQVTGIMIGGQPDYVGWNYIRFPDSDNDFDKLIYDKSSTFMIPGSGASETMYTLCWDNYDASLDAGENPTVQNTVYVALELVNKTGRDFWGELNMVRRDGTFYLVGALTPTTAGGATNIPASLTRSNYFYPPYDAEGNTINSPRVFMQDYATNATLVLGVNSLRHAYVTVPDLRASQVSLGLSVDMSWSPGLTFSNVVMGGN